MQRRGPTPFAADGLEIDQDFDEHAARAMLSGLGLGDAEPKIAAILKALYAIYRARDAELIEINPLALLKDGRVVALDCKFTLDDAAIFGKATSPAKARRKSSPRWSAAAPRPG